MQVASLYVQPNNPNKIAFPNKITTAQSGEGIQMSGDYTAGNATTMSTHPNVVYNNPNRKMMQKTKS